MIKVKGGVFMDDFKYLKACGFAKDSSGNLISNVNAFYPKLSCILVHNDDETEDYEFVLHYSPDEGYMRSQVHFSFQEVDELREKLGREGLLKYFSIPDSFLSKVRRSRTSGQAHWKKRHFPLPFKSAKVMKVLGIQPIAIDKFLEAGYDKEQAWRNMQYCISKAAISFNLQFFEPYYEDWKLYYARVGRSAAFSQFVKAVEELQASLE